MNRLTGTLAAPTAPRVDLSQRSTLYPLRFEPILKQLIWGGRRLGSVLGKTLGAGDDYAESWEIADHRSGVSRVSEGHLAGSSISDLLDQYGSSLLGTSLPDLFQFPLLVKYLDAHQALSVQVHPNDELGRRLVGDNGKTEAWVILHAEPGSFIYAGLREGVTREQFESVLGTDGLVPLLNCVPARAGDCFPIRAGTVHAIGSGVLLAEVQQMSDATFRVYDWDRRDSDGRSRTLHLAESLESIDFDIGPVGPSTPEVVHESWGTRERLARLPQFSLERLRFSGRMRVGSRERFTLLLGLNGTAQVHHDGAAYSLTLGETLLLPAALRSCEITSDESTSILMCVVP